MRAKSNTEVVVKYLAKKAITFGQKHSLKWKCLKNINWTGVHHGNAIRVRVWKIKAMDAINEVWRLCFGGALLFALIFKRLSLFEK